MQLRNEALDYPVGDFTVYVPASFPLFRNINIRVVSQKLVDGFGVTLLGHIPAFPSQN
jgi:hypothetical protein